MNTKCNSANGIIFELTRTCGPKNNLSTKACALMHKIRCVARTTVNKKLRDALIYFSTVIDTKDLCKYDQVKVESIITKYDKC